MKQFFFFGDSITLGVNDPKGNGWVGQFAKGISDNHGLTVPPTTFYNLGVRKNSSREIRGRWVTEFSSRQFPAAQNFLLFCFGTVDTILVSGTPNVFDDESVANARSILSAAKESGEVLLMSAPPVKDKGHSKRISALMLDYEQVCTEIDVPFLDIFTPLSKRPYYLDSLTDAIHPDTKGNGLIAGMLLNSSAVRRWMRVK